jgi:hypothetical protein
LQHFSRVLSEGIPLGENEIYKKYGILLFDKQVLVDMPYPTNIKIEIGYNIFGWQVGGKYLNYFKINDGIKV